MTASKAMKGSDTVDSPQVIVYGDAKDIVQEVVLGKHHLIADEPESVGGSDAGPNPYELLLAALGACTSITLGMYARRKHWPLEAVRVSLQIYKIHAADCESCETKAGMIDRIDRNVELIGPLDDGQRARLLDIANKCPVHRTLTSEILIQTFLVKSA